MYHTASDLLAPKVHRTGRTVNMSLAQGPSPNPLIEMERAGDGHAPCERRKSLRLPLQWPVYVARVGATHPLSSKTRDVSSNGFYCVVYERLAIGEPVECDLIVPTHMTRGGDDVLFLRCQARVVRVENIDAGAGYGLACRIEDYCLVHGGEALEAPLCRDAALM